MPLAVPPGADLSHIQEALRPLAVPLRELTLDPENANTHPVRNLEAIANSLKMFGQDQPLVVQKNGLIIRKGNGRAMAAMQKLGWEYMAAVIVDEDRLKAIQRSLADNRTSELSIWDDSRLTQLLQEQYELNPELIPAMGWDENEYRVLVNSDTSFLDDGADAPIENDAPDEDAATSDPSTPVVEDNVNFNCPLKESQHRKVLAAVSKARADLGGTATLGECLVTICEAYTTP